MKFSIMHAIGAAAIAFAFMQPAVAQTSNTGELTGSVTDATGAIVPGAQISVVNEATGETRNVLSNSGGVFTFPLLSPGTYSVTVRKTGFKAEERKGVQIDVTDIQSLTLRLDVGSVSETVEVTTAVSLVQGNSPALGAVVGEKEISNLPLVTRNFTQILGLEAGVQMPVTNAAEVGRGSGSSTGGGNPITDGAKIAHGNRQYDNDFQLNGVETNDVLGNGVLGGVDVSGGIPTPNPDTISEFKVQTAQYDASFGRNAGAQINVITKGGSNDVHGSAWEYFRNEDLNANDWFRKLAHQPRGRLRQNQYGAAVGGHIFPSKLLYFGSYQGTKQSNGVAGPCLSSVSGPANLTNDRSAATLGLEFGGQAGANGGTAVAANGSNINPIALALLQYKLSNGAYLIPTPQTTVAGHGFSSFSVPCNFSEQQFVADLNYLQSTRNVVQGRFFFNDSNQSTSFPSGNVPGFTQFVADRYRVGSVTDTFSLSSHLVNEATFGLNSASVKSPGQSPVTYPSLGIPSPVQGSLLLGISITGSYSLTSGFNTSGNHALAYNFNDLLSYTLGRHTFRFGAGTIRQHVDPSGVQTPNGISFQSFPDFLLGLPGGPTGNGTAFSNVFSSSSLGGLTGRQYRGWNIDGFAQDDWKMSSRLTVNLGFRYEYVGAYADALGRNAAIYTSLLNPNPPSTGSLAGVVVASNYPGGTSNLPAGVTSSNNEFASYGGHPNTFTPRIGFAFSETPKFVTRGGYGLFVSSPTLQNLFQSTQGQPWSQSIAVSGAANVNASFQNPYPGVNLTPAFPTFLPYSPTTALSQPTQDPNVRPGLVQTFSIDQQSQLAQSFALEIGYVGSMGQHLLNNRRVNAAGFATVSNPIRGITSNSTANIAQRVPYEGFSPTGFYQTQTEARDWYNGLEVTGRKRLSQHLQALLSYTWSKVIDTEGTSTTAASSAGTPPGNPNVPNHIRGLTDYDRRHRFSASYLFEFPITRGKGFLENTFVNGWQLAGVTTIQTGTALTPVTTNSKNYAGITADLAQLSGSCLPGHVTTVGPVNARVTNYFNTSCFGTAPVVDGTGATAVTGFGNTGIGTARGPDQDNTDLSLVKRTHLNFPNDSSNLEFRTEFFNVFNLPQFMNPGTTVSTATTFGDITAMSVSSRVIQFAMKYNF